MISKKKWINTAIRTPELKPVKFHTVKWKQSKSVPVLISGVKGWYKGYLYSSLDGTFVEWKVDGFNTLEDDRIVTHWLDIELPDER